MLLHFGSQAENVLWFWSLVATGAIPAISTPLATDAAARKHHLMHLRKLLQLRTVLTSAILVEELVALDDVCVLGVDTLEKASPSASRAIGSGFKGGAAGHPDMAFLMLTSGSTGRAKAVEIHYSQLFEALQGKIQALDVSAKNVFLNWIGTFQLPLIFGLLTSV